MGYGKSDRFEIFEQIKKEMRKVYLHDQRPWMIGFSGGKDSTLLVQLTMEMIKSLKPAYRTKKVYVVTSDTLVENPVVRAYMHKMSEAINTESQKKHLNVEAHIIYPEIRNSFWSLVIGLGYPTPEPPGFRWCTERLKILPSNRFTLDTIKADGEVVILLGVRKAESAARSRSITSREIEGRLLVPHDSIAKAYVYNPISSIKNSDVWEYLLKDNGNSAWNTDNKFLFSLYQGENLGEEASVIGEVDQDKIPVTGNSRFGCWVCTMVKEDKSLSNFINHGSTELIPLRDFRGWLLEMRSNPSMRESKRRDGSVYVTASGELGKGPFTMEARKTILRRLLRLQKETGFDLISVDELKMIDRLWEDEGDLSRRALVDLYYEETGERLPWDEYKRAKYDDETQKLIQDLCTEHEIPFELVSKLLIAVDNAKFFTRSAYVNKEVERVMNQGWLHFDAIRGEIEDED